MNNYLFIFSISPVQSFISQARKTKDLYAGSYLLSEFSRKQIKFLCNQNNVEIIFPNNINSESLPNRFLAKIIAESDRKISEIGKKLQENFKKILENEFNNLIKKLNIISNKQLYLGQLMNTFESYWAAIKLGDNYKNAYLELEKIHAATKNIKKFKQTMEQGRKCSLCGERNAYFYGNYKNPAFIDKDLSFKVNKENVFIKNEALCTTCAIKRFTNIAFPSVSEIALKNTIEEQDLKYMDSKYHNTELFYEENLTTKFLDKNGISIKNLQKIRDVRNEILEKYNLKSSNLPKYYAVIMFDGDNMGKLLAGKSLKDENDLEKFHKELSKSLSNNAEKAKDIVDKYGKTIYAGGDDFLGFVPLKNLMIALKELRETFKKCINDKLSNTINGQITMSAGVVISHYKMPLKVVLDQARNMEKLAKDSGKDSFAIAVLKHSGEIHKTCWKWYDLDEHNVGNIEKIIEKIRDKKFSTNFIHTLEREFLKLYNKKSKKLKNLDLIFENELKRLIRKSALIKDKQLKNNEIKELYELCQGIYYGGKSEIFNYLELLRIIDFISRHIGGEK